MKKTLIPNDFRDFTSLLSLLGFVGIFLLFTLNISWLNDNMTPLFLILGGSAFLVVGKVFAFGKMLRDGIQANELTQLVTIIVGFSALILGSLLLFGISLPERVMGYVGIVALIPAVYTAIDYYIKNKK